MERLQKKGSSKIALYMILLVIATGTMIAIRQCRGSEASTYRAEGDTISVAIQYSPVSFFMDGDSLGGFDFSLLKMSGLNYKIYPITTPAQGLEGLDNGRYDLVIADLPRSAADSGRYLFTEPAYIDRQVLVQMRDSAGAEPTIKSVLDLADDTVYVTGNSPMAERIRNIARETGSDIHVVEVPTSSEQLVLRQIIGDIAGPSVVNEQVARSIAADNPELDCSVVISFSQFQPWVLRPDETALCRRINQMLDSIKATPSYQTLSLRYLEP